MGKGNSKFDELFAHLPPSPSTHIIVIGLKNAGKSTIMRSMGLKSRLIKIPMEGMPILTVKSGRRVHITAWDIGGPRKLKSVWEHYFSVAQGIMFVVDSNDTYSIREASQEFHLVLNNKKLNNVPVMVMANKQDQSDTLSTQDISTALRLCDLDRMWDIIATSGKLGNGLYEAFHGLVDMIKTHKGGKCDTD